MITVLPNFHIAVMRLLCQCEKELNSAARCECAVHTGYDKNVIKIDPPIIIMCNNLECRASARNL